MTSSPITLTFTPIAANGDGVSTLPDCPTTGPTPVATTLTINPINPPVATPAPNQNTASATASSTQVATTPATTSTTKTVTTAKKVTPKASNTLSTKNDSSKSSLATVLIILLILILIGLAVVFGLYKKGKIKNLPLFPKSKTEKPKTPGRQKKK
jgi:cobalamin biosynthesis Mg chelatase CobN